MNPNVSLIDWFTHQGLGMDNARIGAAAIMFLGVVVVAVLANFIAKAIVLRVVERAVRRSKAQWDDTFLTNKFFERLSHLAPAIVLHNLGPLALANFPEATDAVRTMATIYMAAVGISVVSGALNAGLDIYETLKVSKKVPIKSVVQVLKIILYFVGTIFILSQLLGQSPLVFLSGIGAFTAVLLLIFKDAILGLVAGIQLSAQDMVAKGDWISMPKFGADGDVIDVSLTTVKVQNWDKTISMVPTYALISDSFQNWRGMTESGGRRIKRSVSIDMNSVRFVDATLFERFEKVEFLQDYLKTRNKEIEAFNREHKVDSSLPINGRRMTNLGTFRAYLEGYLRNHAQIHDSMTFLVRQLAPTEHGVPMQIYVFSRDQDWANYESIQADIFDHILAVLPMFELRVFQNPSGADLRALANAD